MQTGLPLANVKGLTESTAKSEAVVLGSFKLLVPLSVKHNIELPLEQFKKLMEISVTDNVIDVALEWEDREAGERILNDLLENFVEEVARRRAVTLANFCRDLERSLLANQAKLEHSRDKVAMFYANNGKTDHTRAAELLISGIAMTETALDSAETSVKSLQSQLEGLKSQRAQLLAQAKQVLIEARRTKHIAKMAFHSKGSDGHTQLSTALEKLEKIAEDVANDEVDLAVFREKLNGLDMKSFLTDENQKLVEHLNQRIEQFEDRIRDVGFSIEAKKNEVGQIQARLEDKQRRMAEQPGAAHANEPLDLMDDVRQAEAMQDVLAHQLTGARQLEKSRVHEYTIVAAATLAKETPPNWLKRIVVVFSAAMMVLLLPVLGWEFFSSRGTPADAAARRFGLPVLARMSHSNVLPQSHGLAISGKEELRLLALRIQQFIPNAGSVILFSPLDPLDSPVNVICQLAECFADREERVLIIDMSRTPAVHDHLLTRYMSVVEHIEHNGAHRSELNGTPANGAAVNGAAGSKHGGSAAGMIERTTAARGVSDFLRDETLDFASLVSSPASERVHFIPAGEREFPRECFGTRRMTDFIEQCRRRYSMVLVSAPPASESADLQMLAARADGILFTASHGKRRARHNYHALQELLEIDAPVLGVVGYAPSTPLPLVAPWTVVPRPGKS